MKRVLSAILTLCIVLTASASVFAGSNGITVIADGKTLEFDVEPEIINDRTMVPMRVIFEALGAKVDWNDSSKTITSTKGSATVKMQIQNPSMSVNQTEKTLDSVPVIRDGRTLVPARAVAEALDADVKWCGGSKTVIITCDAKDKAHETKITTNYGDVDLILYENIAPITVANFKKLAGSDFYSGLMFHRVIKDFMIQGGGYTLNTSKESSTLFDRKDAETIKGEFTENGVTNNLKHTRGVISMARANDPDSASSEFFIVHKDSPHLDGKYAAFGVVVDGMDTVDKIAELQTVDLQGVGEGIPLSPVMISSVTVK